MRGESENRNQELQRGLCADRLSDHRFLANDFRLQRHASALNLLVRLRRTVQETFTPQRLSLSNDLPADRAVEALAGPERPRDFHRRRDRDPLGEGHIETWRTRLIKVAAEVIVSARRIVVRLAPGWPHLHHFQAVSQAILNLAPRLFPPTSRRPHPENSTPIPPEHSTGRGKPRLNDITPHPHQGCRRHSRKADCQ